MIVGLLRVLSPRCLSCRIFAWVIQIATFSVYVDILLRCIDVVYDVVILMRGSETVIYCQLYILLTFIYPWLTVYLIIEFLMRGICSTRQTCVYLCFCQYVRDLTNTNIQYCYFIHLDGGLFRYSKVSVRNNFYVFIYCNFIPKRC